MNEKLQKEIRDLLHGLCNSSQVICLEELTSAQKQRIMLAHEDLKSANFHFRKAIENAEGLVENENDKWRRRYFDLVSKLTDILDSSGCT